MIFLIDEDVDHFVGDLLGDRHDVRFVVDVLGSGAKDPTVEQYVRTQHAILVTADNIFAKRLRQRDRRLPCLWLHDLVTEERNRVGLMLGVIEREGEVAGDRFHMEIRLGSFHVQR